MAPSVAAYDFVGDFTQTTATESSRIRWDAGTEFTADDMLLMFFHFNFKNVPNGKGAVTELDLDAANTGPNASAESRYDWSERAEGSSGYLMKHGGKFFSQAINSYVDLLTHSETAAGDADWVNMGGLAINVQDIASDATQFVRASVTHTGAVSTSTGTDLETVSITPNEAGEKWLIVGHTTFRVGSNETITSNLLDADNSVLQTYTFHQYTTVGTDDYTTIPHLYVWTAPDTNAAEIAIEGVGVGTVEKFVSHLTAVRLDSLSNNWASARPSDYTTVSGTAEEAVTGASLALTGAGNDVVLLGIAANTPATVQDGMNMWMSDDDNVSTIPATYTTWNNSDNLMNPHRGDGGGANKTPVVYVARDAAVSGATTYKLYQTGEVTAAVMEDIDIIAIEMDGGDGGPASAGGYNAQKSHGNAGRMIVAGA